MVGDVLYSCAPISAEVRAQIADLGFKGPFALEIFDARDDAWARVVAQVRAGARLVVVPRLDDLGAGSRQVTDRLVAVSDAGGWTFDVLGGILGSEKQSRAIVRALQWARRVDFARNSAARSAGRRRATSAGPEPPALCSCGHKPAAHLEGGVCVVCYDERTNEPKCRRFEIAVPPQATTTFPATPREP